MLDMIYKEENVLFPTAADVLTEGDWAGVREGEEKIGYALVEPGDEWKPSAEPTVLAGGGGRQDLP